MTKRKMKDSGVVWIGQVPEGWKILNLLYVLRRRISDGPHETPVCIDEGIPFISVDSLNDTEDIDFSVVKKFISQKDFELFSQRSRIEVGDILFSKAATIGKTAIVKNLGFMVWSPLAIIKPDCEKSDTKYLYYGLNCEGLVNAARLAGSMNTQANVGMRELEKVKVPLPPLSEQRKIAAFLDGECGKIDVLRGKVEKQIAALEEYRKSVITEAVTKGIKRGRKMKPSGVEWIGEVPDGWTVTRAKYHIFVKSNLVPPDEYLDFPQISPESIEKGNGHLCKWCTVEEACVESGNHLFRKGQILYSKIRPVLNKVVIAPFDGLCSADMYPIETSEDVKFVLYLMLSDYFVSQVELVTRDRIKMPKINQSELGNVKVVFPSIPEQREIAAYLDKKCATIDSMVAKCREELDRLAEYKKSLIYEYVTGKKEVA